MMLMFWGVVVKDVDVVGRGCMMLILCGGGCIMLMLWGGGGCMMLMLWRGGVYDVDVVGGGG